MTDDPHTAPRRHDHNQPADRGGTSPDERTRMLLTTADVDVFAGVIRPVIGLIATLRIVGRYRPLDVHLDAVSAGDHRHHHSSPFDESMTRCGRSAKPSRSPSTASPTSTCGEPISAEALSHHHIPTDSLIVELDAIRTTLINAGQPRSGDPATRRRDRLPPPVLRRSRRARGREGTMTATVAYSNFTNVDAGSAGPTSPATDWCSATVGGSTWTTSPI